MEQRVDIELRAFPLICAASLSDRHDERLDKCPTKCAGDGAHRAADRGATTTEPCRCSAGFCPGHRCRLRTVATSDILGVDSERAVWREVGDEVVILDVSSSTYFSLNGSGKLLWQRLDEGSTLQDLVRVLAEAYSLTSEQAESDTQDFVSALLDAGLVKRLDGAAEDAG